MKKRVDGRTFGKRGIFFSRSLFSLVRLVGAPLFEMAPSGSHGK